MGKLLALLGGWQGYAAAAGLAALLSVSATYYLTSISYRLTIAVMERDKASDAMAAANFALKQYGQDADAIHAAALTFSATQQGLDEKLRTVSREFNAAIKANPLPADCKPDAVRLRALSGAVAATNSAAGFQSGPAVPARP